jgi:hypothetical protein
MSLFDLVQILKEFPPPDEETRGVWFFEGDIDEFTWKLDPSTKLYEITFLYDNKSYTLHASVESLRRFGHELELEMISAPNDSYYDYYSEVDTFPEVPSTYDDVLYHLQKRRFLQFKYKGNDYNISSPEQKTWYFMLDRDIQNIQTFDTYEQLLEQVKIENMRLIDIFQQEGTYQI